LQSFSSRGLHSTACASRFRFLISHSFQGKPPDPDVPQPSSSKAGLPRPKKQIGWPNTSEIGKWRDGLLGGGEAGEDSLMVATIDGAVADQAGDIAIGVADGVGSWSENGVDPALFS
jgi:protein phosphatase PTC7